MKRIITICMVLLLMAPVVHTPVKADMGPKPSVVIDIQGFSKNAWATLLSDQPTTGPVTAVYSAKDIPGYFDEEQKDILMSLTERRDEFQGYYLMGFLDKLDDDQLAWTYYPPQKFRILVYEPDSDHIYISEPLSRYAFDTTYMCLLQDNKLVVTNNYDVWHNGILPFLVRCLATILIELAIGFLFGIKDKQGIRIVIWTNIVTQVIINLVFGIYAYREGEHWMSYFLVLIPMEIVVMILEGFWYTKKLSPYTRHPVLYAIVANVASAVAGYFLIIH